MKMILWKEWRENLRWALLAMLALGLAEFYSLSTNDYQNEAALLCRPTFLMATTFGTAVVGLVLGFIQVIPELGRDKWASLLHRPVSRATILYGKVLAGVLLYLVATVPPFLACIWYVATPGNFSIPFVPGMVLPGLANILGGTIYYFAALFVGLRRGGWLDPRPLAFLAAVAGAFMGTSFNSFAWSVAVMLLFSATFFAAALGAMVSNGRIGDQPWISRVALVAIMLLGVFGVGLLGLLFVGNFIGSSSYTLTSYEVALDGKPVKITTSSEADSVVTDLDGKVVMDPNLTSGGRYNFLLRFEILTKTFVLPRLPSEEQNPWYSGYRENQRYVMTARGSISGAERWFYLPGERCFVGYVRRTKALIGAVGREGFQPGSRTAAPFLEPRLYTDYDKSVGPLAQFGPTVYFLTLDERKLKPVFTGPEGGIFGLKILASSQRDDDPWKWGVAALRDCVQIFDREGNPVVQLPYQWDVDRWSKIALAVNRDRNRFYLRCAPSDDLTLAETRKMPDGLEELNLEGKVVRSYSLPPLPPSVSEDPLMTALGESVLPPALVYGGMAWEKLASLKSDDAARTYQRDLEIKWDDYRNLALRMTPVSLLLAVLTLLWARKTNFPWTRAWAWAALVLGFNLVGLITFRLVADWPVRVKCPTCSRKRPVETEVCPHCHSTWPKNVSRGTEIFEEKATAAGLVSTVR